MKKLDDLACLFWFDTESVRHLFCEFVVAKNAWEMVSRETNYSVGEDYEYVAKLWSCNKKFGDINMISTAVFGILEILCVSRVLPG
jgi:hypothetical protein